MPRAAECGAWRALPLWKRSPQGIDTAHPSLSKCLYSPYSSRKLPINSHLFSFVGVRRRRYKHLAGTKLNLAPGKCLCTPECFFFLSPIFYLFLTEMAPPRLLISPSPQSLAAGGAPHPRGGPGLAAVAAGHRGCGKRLGVDGRPWIQPCGRASVAFRLGHPANT